MSEQIVKRRPMIDLEEFERRLRQPLAVTHKDDDPLAELARGFPGEEADPYKTMFEPLSRRPSGAWRGEQDRAERKVEGARQPLIGGDFASIEAGLLGSAHYDSPEGLSASGDEAESCQREGQEHWPFGGAEASHEADTAYEEVRSRRPLYVMAAMIVAGIAGIGASFGFKGAVSNPNEIATIRAADGPAKIQPETVASTEAPDRDATVLGGAPQQPPIAAINTVEQPADLSAQAAVARVPSESPAAVAGITSGAASVPVPAPPAQAHAQAQSESLSIASLIEPKKVKTVSVRPDGTLLPNDARQQVAAPVPPAAAPAAGSPAKAATPKSTARVAATPKPPAGTTVSGQAARPATAAKTKQVQTASAQEQVPAAATAQAVAGGSYAVQLAAPGTEQEARETQVRLMKKFSSELAGFRPSIHKAEVGGKAVYRVRVSGLASKDEAAALCQKVQSGGGNCFVAKN